jgi:hypothetical protein
VAQAGTKLADLHDTPGRMLAKRVIHGVVKVRPKGAAAAHSWLARRLR